MDCSWLALKQYQLLPGPLAVQQQLHLAFDGSFLSVVLQSCHAQYLDCRPLPKPVGDACDFVNTAVGGCGGTVCVPVVGTERNGVVVVVVAGQRWSDSCTRSGGARAGRDDRLGWTLVMCRDKVLLVKILGYKKKLEGYGLMVQGGGLY